MVHFGLPLPSEMGGHLPFNVLNHTPEWLTTNSWMFCVCWGFKAQLIRGEGLEVARVASAWLRTWRVYVNQGDQHTVLTQKTGRDTWMDGWTNRQTTKHLGKVQEYFNTVVPMCLAWIAIQGNRNVLKCWPKKEVAYRPTKMISFNYISSLNCIRHSCTLTCCVHLTQSVTLIHQSPSSGKHHASAVCYQSGILPMCQSVYLGCQGVGSCMFRGNTKFSPTPIIYYVINIVSKLFAKQTSLSGSGCRMDYLAFIVIDKFPCNKKTSALEEVTRGGRKTQRKRKKVIKGGGRSIER